MHILLDNRITVMVLMELLFVKSVHCKFFIYKHFNSLNFFPESLCNKLWRFEFLNCFHFDQFLIVLILHKFKLCQKQLFQFYQIKEGWIRMKQNLTKIFKIGKNEPWAGMFAKLVNRIELESIFNFLKVESTSRNDETTHKEE